MPERRELMHCPKCWKVWSAPMSDVATSLDVSLICWQRGDGNLAQSFDIACTTRLCESCENVQRIKAEVSAAMG